MADPTNAVRQAVFARLSAASLGAPVFSTAPANQRPPYILLDEVSLEAANTKQARAWPVTVSVVSVVEATSPAAVELYMSRVLDALQDVALTLPGLTAFPLRLTASTAEREADNLLFFGRQTFRTTAQI
jgi:hypothetical protein